MATPWRDDIDVVGRLLMNICEIHERVIARGGSGLEGIRLVFDASERYTASLG
jgi:hypothetical protein